MLLRFEEISVRSEKAPRKARRSIEATELGVTVVVQVAWGDGKGGKSNSLLDERLTDDDEVLAGGHEASLLALERLESGEVARAWCAVEVRSRAQNHDARVVDEAGLVRCEDGEGQIRQFGR